MSTNYEISICPFEYASVDTVGETSANELDPHLSWASVEASCQASPSKFAISGPTKDIIKRRYQYTSQR